MHYENPNSKGLMINKGVVSMRRLFMYSESAGRMYTAAMYLMQGADETNHTDDEKLIPKFIEAAEAEGIKDLRAATEAEIKEYLQVEQEMLAVGREVIQQLQAANPTAEQPNGGVYVGGKADA